MNKTAIWIVFWCCIIAFWGVTAYWVFGGDGRDTTASVADAGGEPKDPPAKFEPKTEPKTEPKKDNGKPPVANSAVEKSTPKTTPKTAEPATKKPAVDTKKSSKKPKKDKTPPKSVADKKPPKDKGAPAVAKKEKESPETVAAKKAKAAADAREYKEVHDEHANAFWVYLTTSRVPHTRWTLAERPVALPLGPQPTSTARIYLNNQAAANTQKFSHGSVIVAEELDAQGNVSTLTVWHCVDPGYSKKTNDWYWIQFDAAGKVLKSVAD